MTEDWKNIEINEWLGSLDYVYKEGGQEKVKQLLDNLQTYAYSIGTRIPFTSTTPYINSIPVQEEFPYPGDLDIENRIQSIIRWNAMAMVVKAQSNNSNVGGHISTYASCSSLYEVGFNHFFRGKQDNFSGDLVYFQGHSSPGVYSRAFLENRLTAKQLHNFRRELSKGGGLSSYPHPRLMPSFWQFPTVSMGLGPIMSIYQARFMKYLESRGIKEPNGEKIWCFIGDGESDEPETLGAINMASREKLDNLIFVVNCNLQRLDGPVRGNGKIIQELEGIFRGAGWNTLKLIWGKNWDSLFAKDKQNTISRRMMDLVDGHFQKLSISTGAEIRSEFFNTPKLQSLVKDLSNYQIKKLKRGGHDRVKIYNAYKRAFETKDSPTVILAKTIKGYGLGETGEGKNISHNQKKLNEQELLSFRDRFNIPIQDKDLSNLPFYKPDKNSKETQYLMDRRTSLGGFIPARFETTEQLQIPNEETFKDFYTSSGKLKASTTMAFHRILVKLLKDKEIGSRIVPIIPDEARTFGMEGLFRQIGIYSQVGQLYDPVDQDNLLYYKESATGQILEEGINEAGAISSFCAAGTSYSNYEKTMIPFYIFYSMFGFQRIGDFIWAGGDLLCRGFLLGGTAGRTSLNGEGLQHQDGHSHVLFSTVPNVLCYDPAFAFELSIIIEEGLKRMYTLKENIFYYITVTTDAYSMPKIPADIERVKEGVVKGIYRFNTFANTQKRASKPSKRIHKAHLFGSGSIINSVLKAQKKLLAYNVKANVWSVTSYNEIRRNGLDCDRWNMLNPDQKPKVPFISQLFAKEKGVIVASSDYMKLQPDSIAKWLPEHTLVSLGTDGFGLSETREKLRDHFEIDENFIVLATLTALRKEGKITQAVLMKATKKLSVNPNKNNPLPLI